MSINGEPGETAPLLESGDSNSPPASINRYTGKLMILL